MPAQTTTSADKKRQAQQARRQAALKKSGRQPRTRQKASATAVPTSSSPVESNKSRISHVDQTSTDAVASVSERPEMEDFFLSSSAASISKPEELPITLDDSGDSAGTDIDTLCEIVDTNPGALGSDLNSVRVLCRNRRKALSRKGKSALPGKRRGSGKSRTSATAMAFAAGKINGRDMAKMRRQEMADKGRGNEPKARPSGRVRPKVSPPKVEVGTTLSGKPVSGTQVERTPTMTGNESGTCRAITGTEYIGAEQFATFCGAKPEPNPPKVGMSITGGGRPVSGTEVGRSSKVTGDEQGTCVNVTGSEYVGADKMADFCGVTPSQKPSKVMPSRTVEKQLLVTGADEARSNATTGNEAGAQHQITGSQYADTGAAKMTINGPSKVALTHTIAGQSVTGTEVGRSAKVTGDEYGSCRPVTGTEYISNEQFASVCGTIAEPHPAKVGIDNSLQGQRITGALVDRTEKVTGNEPGSCSHLTGTQYGENKLCGGAAPKVNEMHTLTGNDLTGNTVDLFPKMTGDEQGGCLPVTGTEYYGQEQFAQCPSTPYAQPAKVGVDHTPKGQHVSGTMVNAAENVTGNEQGAEQAVSGTPYSSIQVAHNHGACCDACAAKDAAIAAGLVAPEATPHAQPVAALAPLQQAIPVAPAAAPQDFSIVSPARAANITGSQYGGSRVTGPGDMATNRVSGTPEFRYPDTQPITQPAPAQIMAAPQPQPDAQVMQAAVQQPAPAEAIVKHSQRITGEGREDGVAVTGDNWGRGSKMTGTEGHVVQSRNPTLRGGEMHQPLNNAHMNMHMVRPEVPAARVTGSSGNTHDGAVITVSGGARG